MSGAAPAFRSAITELKRRLLSIAGPPAETATAQAAARAVAGAGMAGPRAGKDYDRVASEIIATVAAGEPLDWRRARDGAWCLWTTSPALSEQPAALAAVIEGELRTALDVVRRQRGASPEERRAFLRNPRPALAAALGGDAADMAAALLFVETKQYSERVTGLGLWDPPKLPWLVRKPSGWLPESFKLQIGERTLDFTPEKLDALIERTDVAKAAGEPEIEIDGTLTPLPTIEAAIAGLRGGTTLPEADALGPSSEPPASERLVLQIKSNVEGVDYMMTRPQRRCAIAPGLPEHLLRSAPKAHRMGAHCLADVV